EILLSIDDHRGLAELAASNDIRMSRSRELARQRKLNAERSARALFMSEVAERFDSLAADGPSEVAQSTSLVEEIESVLSRIAARDTSGGWAAQETGVFRRSRLLHPFRRGGQTLMSVRTDERSRGLFLAVQTILGNQYTLDMGVPYSQSSALPVVFPDRKQRAGLDQETLMRAASLAGLIIGPAGAPQQVEKFIALEEAARERPLRRADLADWLRRH